MRERSMHAYVEEVKKDACSDVCHVDHASVIDRANSSHALQGASTSATARERAQIARKGHQGLEGFCRPIRARHVL